MVLQFLDHLLLFRCRNQLSSWTQQFQMLGGLLILAWRKGTKIECEFVWIPSSLLFLPPFLLAFLETNSHWGHLFFHMTPLSIPSPSVLLVLLQFPPWSGMSLRQSVLRSKERVKQNIRVSNNTGHLLSPLQGRRLLLLFVTRWKLFVPWFLICNLWLQLSQFSVYCSHFLRRGSFDRILSHDIDGLFPV